MGLDIRLPLGLLFTVIGALLAIFGALSDGSIYARSLNINVNLWWGLVMVGFGVVFLWFSLRRPVSTQSSVEPERSVKGAAVES
jgi:hypothetical protein